MDYIFVVESLITLKDLVNYFYFLFFIPRHLGLLSVLSNVRQTCITLLKQQNKGLLIRIQSIDIIIEQLNMREGFLPKLLVKVQFIKRFFKLMGCIASKRYNLHAVLDSRFFIDGLNEHTFKLLIKNINQHSTLQMKLIIFTSNTMYKLIQNRHTLPNINLISHTHCKQILISVRFVSSHLTKPHRVTIHNLILTILGDTIRQIGDSLCLVGLLEAGSHAIIIIIYLISQLIIIIVSQMGNQQICSKDTRDFKSSTYLVCGKEPDFRASTSINIINYVPVVSGPPLNFQKQQTFKKVEKSAAEFCQKNDLDNSYIPLVARIIAYGHTNIFMAYRKLPEHSKQQFLEEIKYADIDFADSLYHKFLLGEKEVRKSILPPSKVVDRQQLSENQKRLYYQSGRKMLQQGEVAFLFLCAGSSSRFFFQQKLIYPLELKSGKTLIELLLERLKRNLKVPQTQIASVPLIFACNQNNRMVFENFLRNKNYCGFDNNKFRFLTIPNLPVLNSKGKLCLTFQFKILNRPSGTAKCIEQFLGSGLYNSYKNSKISTIHIVGCENIMENPGDPLFLGFFRENKLEMLGKCVDPIFPTQQFNRFCGANNGKTYYISPQQILNSKINENILEKLMEQCPVAVNSVICGLTQLKQMTKDYQNSMFLSLQYNCYKKNENYYDFEKEKPLVNSPVNVFQKDLGHLFTCSKKNSLMKVPRDQFVPILTKNGSYSMRQACKKLIEVHQSSLNFSRLAG